MQGPISPIPVHASDRRYVTLSCIQAGITAPGAHTARVGGIGESGLRIMDIASHTVYLQPVPPPRRSRPTVRTTLTDGRDMTSIIRLRGHGRGSPAKPPHHASTRLTRPSLLGISILRWGRTSSSVSPTSFRNCRHWGHEQPGRCHGWARSPAKTRTRQRNWLHSKDTKGRKRK